MNQKFVKLLDEGYLSGYVKDNKDRNDIQNVCSCAKPSRSKKKSSHEPNCKAVKQGLVKEDVEELSEGRPKKEKVKSTRGKGRPKDSDVDDGKEGVRDLKLVAYIKAGKKETTDSKSIENASVDSIKKYVQDFENQLTIKYANKWDVDEDDVKVHIKDNLGWTGARAEDQGGNATATGAEEED